MDALNGVAYVDDSQVARLDVTRQVDRLRPRAEVTVKHLSEALEPQKENYTR
jgi:Holliday junction resolvase RusA-like endonuclease